MPYTINQIIGLFNYDKCIFIVYENSKLNFLEKKKFGIIINNKYTLSI